MHREFFWYNSFFKSNFKKLYYFILFYSYFFSKLKFCRPRLPRGYTIGWPNLLVGFGAMSIGLIGIIIFNLQLLEYFIIYLAFFFVCIVITFKRIQIVKLILFVVQQISSLESRFNTQLCDILINMKQHTVCVYICLWIYLCIYSCVHFCIYLFAYESIYLCLILVIFVHNFSIFLL